MTGLLARLTKAQRAAMIASVRRADPGHQAYGVIVRGGESHHLTIAGIDRLQSLGLVGAVRRTRHPGEVSSVRLNEEGVALAELLAARTEVAKSR